MRGLYGHLVGIPAIQDKRAWFCSELVALAAHDIPDDTAHRYRPDHLYYMSAYDGYER